MLRVMQTARSFLFFAPTGSALSNECEVHVPEINGQCNRSPRAVYQIVLPLKNIPLIVCWHNSGNFVESPDLFAQQQINERLKVWL
jgi:hypothetical protein